ncbi:MAG: dTMP kinase [Christensenellales bacterium]|jgi:dTMP kinase
MKGKLIVIEGTDCSGKQTQSERLTKFLNDNGIKAVKFQFPRYDTPTGKILGGPYLGKASIGEGFFPEGAPNVPAVVASLYFAADRVYNVKDITSNLENGVCVVLDRYVESNMAFQGGKIFDENERKEMFEFLMNLEYNLLKLPRPDLKVFLYMPYESACELKKNRPEREDQHEMDENILKNAEKAYKEIASLYNFETVNCTEGKRIKTIDEIATELSGVVMKCF